MVVRLPLSGRRFLAQSAPSVTCKPTAINYAWDLPIWPADTDMQPTAAAGAKGKVRPSSHEKPEGSVIGRGLLCIE